MTQYILGGIALEVEKFEPSEQTEKKQHPIIFVNGMGSQLLYWNMAFLSQFLDQGYTVVRFDCRDSGLSQNYENFSAITTKKSLQKIDDGVPVDSPCIEKPYSLECMADDIKRIMLHFSFEKIHLVGVSMGGMIAQLFGQKYNAWLASITLMSTTTKDNDLPYLDRQAYEYLTGSPKSNSTEDVLAYGAESGLYLGSPDYGTTYETVYAKEKAYMERGEPKGGSSRHFLAIRSSTLNGADNKAVTVPCTVISGGDDKVFCVQHAHRLKETIPHSILHIIDGMGHDLPTGLYETIHNMMVNNMNKGEI